MKKLIILFVVLYKSALSGQTILNSAALELKKNNESNQILNVENTKTHDVFVFAADNENITILKYNSSLFLTDEYKSSLKNSSSKSIVGYSFSPDGNPTIYWAPRDFTIITATKYFLETKKERTIHFKFPAENQYVVADFQQNDTFSILSKDIKEQVLILDIFKNGTVEEKVFDFSSFLYQDNSTKRINFTELLKEFPIEKMDAESYNPLYKSTAKSKIYRFANRMILTLDHNSRKTQLFEINIENQEIKEKNFSQPNLKKARKTSNSFYQDDKLYQMAANEDELFLNIKDYNFQTSLKTIQVSKNDTIRFKISPLLIQRENRKPSELKTTKKYLNHLSYLDGGLSVYKNKENTYITIGATPKIRKEPSNLYKVYNRFENINPITEEYEQPNYYVSNGNNESVFFESVFDSNYTFRTQDQMEPLAVDNIYYFLSTSKTVALDNILTFKDFYILGYYDTKLKQYILRKFKDGFNADENIDPLDTPSSFRKPFSLK